MPKLPPDRRLDAIEAALKGTLATDKPVQPAVIVTDISLTSWTAERMDAEVERLGRPASLILPAAVDPLEWEQMVREQQAALLTE